MRSLPSSAEAFVKIACIRRMIRLLGRLWGQALIVFSHSKSAHARVRYTLGPVENPLLCCNPAMARRVLSDKQWALMAPHCLGKPGDAGPRGTDSRLFVEAVL